MGIQGDVFILRRYLLTYLGVKCRDVGNVLSK